MHSKWCGCGDRLLLVVTALRIHSHSPRKSDYMACALCCRVATVNISLQHALLQRVAGPQQEMLVCIIDNRGVGNSSSPTSQQAYSTTHMARDALAVLVSSQSVCVI